jgi:hypothetical protein
MCVSTTRSEQGGSTRVKTQKMDELQKIGFYGAEGSYSHLAALEYFDAKRCSFTGLCKPLSRVTFVLS